jgi:Phosphate transport (Pho88)
LISLHILVYLLLGGNKKKSVKIWVPPKAKPVLPFGMGPPAEVVKAEDYVETTYNEYEIKLLKESAQGILMSVGISLLMSFKFNVHVSLITQSVSGPVNLIDSLVLKKYLLGMNKDNLYGEFLHEPTEADLPATEDKDKDKDMEPRVVELKDKKEVAKVTKSTGSKCAEVPTKTSVNEID